MPGELRNTLKRISSKASILVERYNVLLKLKQEADGRIEELNSLVEKQKKEIESLQAQVDYLRIATTIVPDRQSLELTRQTVEFLVREIDRCITDLTE